MDQVSVGRIVDEGLAHPLGVVDARTKHDRLTHRVAVVEEGTDLAGHGLVPARKHDVSVDVFLVVDPILDRLAVIVDLADSGAPPGQVPVQVDADHLVGGKEPVVDALFQRVGVDRLTEVVDVGYIFGFLRGGGEPQLDSGVEVVEDGPPLRVRFGASPVALVDHDEVEEVLGELVVDRIPVFGPDDRLVEGEVDLVGRVDPAVGVDELGPDLGHCIGERFEIVDHGLVNENVSVSEEQDPLDLAALPEPPDDVESGVGLACPGRHSQQQALLAK